MAGNGTFDLSTNIQEGEECIPGMFVFKAKLTSRGFLDKLKARMVAGGESTYNNKKLEILGVLVFSIELSNVLLLMQWNTINPFSI